ncbi:hypothetical protein OC846_001909 [Tilletia horrida]|uniref:Uncharacterized protein n=1 Tax=Tilletia horrida TaxID=155126 RepID=A0AAN6JVH7_9BASI|nr:hypothetical protein OC846_001909 [Tilletia horrida]KAK0568330.1 hypothetical protein OC861_002041 [Tilletia horrida]
MKETFVSWHRGTISGGASLLAKMQYTQHVSQPFARSFSTILSKSLDRSRTRIFLNENGPTDTTLFTGPWVQTSERQFSQSPPNVAKFRLTVKEFTDWLWKGNASGQSGPKTPSTDQIPDTNILRHPMRLKIDTTAQSDSVNTYHLKPAVLDAMNKRRCRWLRRPGPHDSRVIYIPPTPKRLPTQTAKSTQGGSRKDRVTDLSLTPKRPTAKTENSTKSTVGGNSGGGSRQSGVAEQPDLKSADRTAQPFRTNSGREKNGASKRALAKPRQASKRTRGRRTHSASKGRPSRPAQVSKATRGRERASAFKDPPSKPDQKASTTNRESAASGEGPNSSLSDVCKKSPPPSRPTKSKLVKGAPTEMDSYHL